MVRHQRDLAGQGHPKNRIFMVCLDSFHPKTLSSAGLDRALRIQAK